MGVRTKARRKISVDGRDYVWYVKEDEESPYMLLNISSIDKKIILSFPLGTAFSYVISKGKYFQGEEMPGYWKRFRYMKDLPEAITPGIVRECIEWAVDGNGAEEIVCNGSTVQV